MIQEEEIYQSHILVVDDNAINITLLEEILATEGYKNVTSTTDPRTVLDLYNKEDFDLLLLDVRMPYINGIELMHMLNEKMKGDYCPIIVLTAQTDQQTRQQALEAGAKDFLTKPFALWEVSQRIKNSLETRYYYKKQVNRAATLEEEVRKRTKDLRETQLEIIRRLGRACEFRDNETGAHVIRMSKGCEVIARGMGLDPLTCENILHASPMHDIGKIAIPDSILLKSGPLTDAEWDTMKTHTTVGAEILSNFPSEVIVLACELALAHHEKWDGTGYPKGLKGEEIPLAARIAAVSDVFDALTSKRAYKEAWSFEKAIETIKKDAGTHFDPVVVEAFLKNVDEIIEIKKNHPDE